MIRIQSKATRQYGHLKREQDADTSCAKRRKAAMDDRMASVDDHQANIAPRLHRVPNHSYVEVDSQHT